MRWSETLRKRYIKSSFNKNKNIDAVIPDKPRSGADPGSIAKLRSPPMDPWSSRDDAVFRKTTCRPESGRLKQPATFVIPKKLTSSRA